MQKHGLLETFILEVSIVIPSGQEDITLLSIGFRKMLEHSFLEIKQMKTFNCNFQVIQVFKIHMELHFKVLEQVR